MMLADFTHLQAGVLTVAVCIIAVVQLFGISPWRGRGSA